MRETHIPPVARRALLLSAVAMGLSACEPKLVETRSQTVEGLEVAYGVAEAAADRAAAAGRADATMHSAPPIPPHLPTSKNAYYVSVAAWDAMTQARINDAKVSLNIRGPGHPGHGATPLHPTRIAGATTYGAYVSLPAAGRYRLIFHISRPGLPHGPVTAVFNYKRP